MKILYIANTQIPAQTANSLQVMKMCEAFAENGHNVLLLSQQKCSLPERKNPFSFYAVRETFRIKQIAIGKLPLNFWLYLLKISIQLLRFRPDIIYTRSIDACNLGTILRYPTVYESHLPVWQKGEQNEALFLRAIKRSSFVKLVTITNTLKEAYTERYELGNLKICVAPDGADNINVETSPKSKNETGLRVGYVGSLNRGKGLEIIAKLAPLSPMHQFVIVGGTEKDIKKWKEKIPTPNISFLGFIEQKRLPEIIEQFDVCLLPNQPSVEPHGKTALNIGAYTSPLKMFQYMAHKKAILASDLPVIREVLDEDNALLVPHDNPTAWAHGLERLTNSDLRDQLGKRAHETFLVHYTWRKRARHVLEC